MPKRTTNWDRMRDKSANDTIAYRDVYADQQLDRTRIGEKKTMTSRNILNAVLTVVVFFVSYYVIGIVQAIAKYLYGYEQGEHSFGYYVGHFSFSRVLICLAIAAVFYGVMYLNLKHNLDVQNGTLDTADINQYQNDQHIALPEEIH